MVGAPSPPARTGRPSDGHLLHGSIRADLLLARPEADEQRLRMAPVRLAVGDRCDLWQACRRRRRGSSASRNGRGYGSCVTESIFGTETAGEFIEHLGVQFVESTGDRVVATWIAGPKLHQPYGIVHGGVFCSVVETLASVGAAVWMGERGKVVGVNNSTDFYRAVREGTLTSTATPVHRGRSQQVWVVETVDEDGRMVSRGQVRLQNLTD